MILGYEQLKVYLIVLGRLEGKKGLKLVAEVVLVLVKRREIKKVIRKKTLRNKLF
jgi:hypothetical protein